MSVCENQIVVYQPNATVRLVSGRMLIDNWAMVAMGDFFAKKRKGVKAAA